MKRKKSSREDGHRISETSTRKKLNKMKTRKSQILGEQIMLDGMMAFGKLETGLRTLDFECIEDVVAEPFVADFHVQPQTTQKQTDIPRRQLLAVART